MEAWRLIRITREDVGTKLAAFTSLLSSVSPYATKVLGFCFKDRPATLSVAPLHNGMSPLVISLEALKPQADLQESRCQVFGFLWCL